MEINTKYFTKDFYLVVAGQIVSIFGASLLRFALSLYVLDMTGRADIFAALYAVSNIPRLLMPVGGAIADRFSRRNLMVLYDFSSSFMILCLFLLAVSGKPSVMVIGAVMVILSIISSMYTPAVNASVPLLVARHKIESANGIVTAVQSLSDVAAPILGGILYSLMGVAPLIIMSCTAFFLSAIMEIFIKIPFEKRAQERNIVRTIAGDMKDGFIYVVKEKFILKAMIMAALLNLILSPLLSVGAPVILRVSLHSPDAMYGVGMGLVSLAAVIGALTISLFIKLLKMNIVYRWLIAAAVLLLPVAAAVMPFMLTFGYYPSFLLLMAGILPIAMILTLLSIFLMSKVQKKTPNENLGKVMAIIMAVAHCTSPIGQIIYGEAFEAFQTNVWAPVLFISAAMFVVATAAQRILKNEGEII
jgi:MFS family permease